MNSSELMFATDVETIDLNVRGWCYTLDDRYGTISAADSLHWRLEVSGFLTLAILLLHIVDVLDVELQIHRLVSRHVGKVRGAPYDVQRVEFDFGVLVHRDGAQDTLLFVHIVRNVHVLVVPLLIGKDVVVVDAFHALSFLLLGFLLELARNGLIS